MKRILVVGGHSGIGAAFVDYMIGVSKEGKHRSTMMITPPQEVLDITDELSISDYLSSEGPFTHIVSTAGVNNLKWAEELTLDDYVRDFSVNAFGFGLLVGAHMRIFDPEEADRTDGYLHSALAVVSDAMRNPMRGSTVYCSSKAALAAIIRNLAREYAGHTRVNGVAPAIVADTPMSDKIDAEVPDFRGWSRDAAAKYERTMLPMGRRVTKAEVADVMYHTLFGPAYQTGTIVDITGGK